MVLVLLLYGSRVFSQNKYGNVWVSGFVYYYKTDFTFSTPNNTLIGNNTNIVFHFSHSNICDSIGKLLLLSDGFNIYNANGDTISGGYQMVPPLWFQVAGPSALGWYQNSLFLPIKNSQYYFITPTYSDSLFDYIQNHPNVNPHFDLLLCSKIDMKKNNGQGRVVKKMDTLVEEAQLAMTQMTACRHGDGKSWWLLKQAPDTNMVYEFLLTQDSTFGPYIQGFVQPHFGNFHNGGQSVISNDGTKYATTSRGSGVVFVADFDRCSGLLSNPKTYPVPSPAVFFDDGSFYYTDIFTESVAFSSNGRFLYIGKYASIMQLDLWDNNMNTAWDTIARMDTTEVEFTDYSTMYIAPDDKIYIGNWNVWCTQMSVINNPNQKGALCGFCPKCLRFPKVAGWSGTVTSPPNMVNYRLGAANPICWPAGVEEVPPQEEITAYPNPFEATLIIKCSHVQNKTFYLYDSFGKLILTKTINENKEQINTANLAAGLYFYSIVNKNGVRLKAGKMVKE